MSTPGKRVVVILVALAVFLPIVGFYMLTGPHGKLITDSERKDSQGYSHWVTVHQLGGRFRIDLSEQGAYSRLLISSYECFPDSLPITNATIDWPTLSKFIVKFSDGSVIICSWSRTNVTWDGLPR